MLGFRQYVLGPVLGWEQDKLVCTPLGPSKESGYKYFDTDYIKGPTSRAINIYESLKFPETLYLRAIVWAIVMEKHLQFQLIHSYRSLEFLELQNV